MQKTYLTKRLSIRPLHESDFEAWVRSQETCLPKQSKFDLDPLPVEKRRRSFFNKYVRKHRKFAKTDEAYVWNLFLKKTGELIGWVDVSTIRREPYQMANFGYFIINIHRRKGYSTEACNSIIRAAFTDLKYHRLEAVTDLDNKPSQRVAVACGLVDEGVRKYYWFQHGRWEDQRVFAITPELLRNRRLSRWTK